MNDVQRTLFLNEIVNRIKQKRKYEGCSITSNPIDASIIADVVYEKGYNMPGLNKEDYKKIISTPRVITPNLTSTDRLNAYILPGETFITYSVRNFIKSKGKFNSLSASGKKLFLNLRKELLKRKIEDFEDCLENITRQTQNIKKELQELEEKFG